MDTGTLLRVDLRATSNIDIIKANLISYLYYY